MERHQDGTLMYPEDGGLKAQLRDINAVPSLHEVVLSHFLGKERLDRLREQR